MKGLPLITGVIALSCVCDTINHLGLKKCTDAVSIEVKGFASLLRFARGILGMPLAWTSIAFSFLSLFLFLYALTMSDLSFAFSLDSLHHVFIAIASWALLKEKIGPLRWVGTGCIVAGITLVALSGYNEG